MNSSSQGVCLGRQKRKDHSGPTMTMDQPDAQRHQIAHYNSKEEASRLLISTLRIDWLLLLFAKLSTCRVTSKRGAFSLVFSPFLDCANFEGTFLHHLHCRSEPFFASRLQQSMQSNAHHCCDGVQSVNYSDAMEITLILMVDLCFLHSTTTTRHC